MKYAARLWTTGPEDATNARKILPVPGTATHARPAGSRDEQCTCCSLCSFSRTVVSVACFKASDEPESTDMDQKPPVVPRPRWAAGSCRQPRPVLQLFAVCCRRRTSERVAPLHSSRSRSSYRFAKKSSQAQSDSWGRGGSGSRRVILLAGVLSQHGLVSTRQGFRGFDRGVRSTGRRWPVDVRTKARAIRGGEMLAPVIRGASGRRMGKGCPWPAESPESMGKRYPWLPDSPEFMAGVGPAPGTARDEQRGSTRRRRETHAVTAARILLD
jgi:hypothetical protein